MTPDSGLRLLGLGLELARLCGLERPLGSGKAHSNWKKPLNDALREYKYSFEIPNIQCRTPIMIVVSP